MTKKCRNCGIAKQPSGFYVNRRIKDGLSSYCKECVSAKNVAYINKPGNRDRKNRRERERRAAFKETLVSEIHDQYKLGAANAARNGTSDLGFVYFVRSGGFVKIGYTGQPDIEDRVSALQTGNPVEIETLYAIRGTYSDEAALHSEFIDYHERGEWFRIEGELRRYLREYMGRDPLDAPSDMELSVIRALRDTNRTRIEIDMHSPRVPADLAEWRARRGLSQAAASRLLGISERSIQRIEGDRPSNSANILRCAARALGWIAFIPAMEMYADGFGPKKIAEELGVSRRYVDSRLSNSRAWIDAHFGNDFRRKSRPRRRRKSETKSAIAESARQRKLARQHDSQPTAIPQQGMPLRS